VDLKIIIHMIHLAGELCFLKFNETLIKKRVTKDCLCMPKINVLTFLKKLGTLISLNGVNVTNSIAKMDDYL